jgi:hypothetical protein
MTPPPTAKQCVVSKHETPSSVDTAEAWATHVVPSVVATIGAAAEGSSWRIVPTAKQWVVSKHDTSMSVLELPAAPTLWETQVEPSLVATIA